MREVDFMDLENTPKVQMLQMFYELCLQAFNRGVYTI